MATSNRLSLADMDLSLGKRTRLYRLMYEHGPGNGTMQFLPIDQGLEHGPRDFFPNPPCADPMYQLRLALEGKYSGIVFQYGIAEKYMKPFVGRVPLVLKLNGKTEIPPDRAPVSPMIASVEDAVRLGADAIGYTLYIGSPRQEEDFMQFKAVREEADRYGMPIIVWAYPRGEAIEAKGGRDSIYAVDYAARVSAELGADIVKMNFPKVDPTKQSGYPKPYDTLNESESDLIHRVVASAGKTLVLISGGERAGDEDVRRKARLSLEAGAAGLIFGRNLWQRPYDEALRMTKTLHDLLLEFPR